MELLDDLCESKLFGGSKSNIRKYNAKDIADLLFLHFCVIQILKHEFHGLPQAQNYLRKTGNLIQFDYWSPARNELYVLLHLLVGRFAKPQQKMLRDQEASQLLLSRIRLDQQNIRRYLRLVQAGQTDPSFERRFFLGLEKSLFISNSYYRAIRRLVQDWPMESESRKRLVITRLLQILRSKARRSELLHILEMVSKKEKAEDKTLQPLDSEGSPIAQKKPAMGFLKGLAAFGAGAIGGYKMTRAKKDA